MPDLYPYLYPYRRHPPCPARRPGRRASTGWRARRRASRVAAGRGQASGGRQAPGDCPRQQARAGRQAAGGQPVRGGRRSVSPVLQTGPPAALCPRPPVRGDVTRPSPLTHHPSPLFCWSLTSQGTRPRKPPATRRVPPLEPHPGEAREPSEREGFRGAPPGGRELAGRAAAPRAVRRARPVYRPALSAARTRGRRSPPGPVPGSRPRHLSPRARRSPPPPERPGSRVAHGPSPSARV